MQMHQLVRRDMALAALVGALPSDFGSEENNFAGEYGDLDDYGSAMGCDSQFGDDFGVMTRYDFGDDYSGLSTGYTSFAQDANSQAMQAWDQEKQRTAARARLLHPNAGSRATIERYAFTVSENIVLGTATAAFTTLTATPDTAIRPQRMTCNAPTVMFAFFSAVRMANVNVTVGNGSEDAFNYSALGVGQMLDMPTLSPSNRATVNGNYTGFTPPGFVNGTTVAFSVTFKGPSTLAAG